MWRKVTTAPLLVGMKTCAATLEISMVIPQEKGNQSTTGSSNSTLGLNPKEAH